MGAHKYFIALDLESHFLYYGKEYP